MVNNAFANVAKMINNTPMICKAVNDWLSNKLDNIIAVLALQAADRGYVMDSGNMILTGNAQALLKDARVQEAYLGA